MIPGFVIDRQVAIGIKEGAAGALEESQPIHEQAFDLRPHADETGQVRIVFAFEDCFCLRDQRFPGCWHIKAVFLQQIGAIEEVDTVNVERDRVGAATDLRRCQEARDVFRKLVVAEVILNGRDPNRGRRSRRAKSRQPQ